MKLRSVLLGTALLCIPGVVDAAEIKSVNVPSANFREGPSPQSTIMFSADKYYPVEIIKRQNGWARVKDFDGDEAWVAERLLGSQETVVINKERVNVRDKAGTSGDVVFKAERGEVFKVLEHKDRWLHVADSNDEKGWIRDDMTWGEHPEADEKKTADKDDEKKSAEKGDDKKSADKGAEKKAADKSAEKKTADKGDEKKTADKDEAKACACPNAEEKNAEKKVDKKQEKQEAPEKKGNDSEKNAKKGEPNQDKAG